jgi:hypothetical protein
MNKFSFTFCRNSPLLNIDRGLLNKYKQILT